MNGTATLLDKMISIYTHTHAAVHRYVGVYADNDVETHATCLGRLPGCQLAPYRVHGHKCPTQKSESSRT